MSKPSFQIIFSMKKNIVFVVLFFLIKISSYGQAPDWLWAVNDSGANYKESNSLALDLVNNSIVGGSFQDSSFNIGSFNLVHDTGSSWNSFIAKFDPLGNAVWAKSFGGGSQIKCVTTDAENKIYAIGCFIDTVLYLDTVQLQNSGNHSKNIFFIKLDSNGTILWAKSIANSSYQSQYAIHIDDLFNIYVAGEYSNSTLQINNVVISNEGGDDVLLAKYDSSGTLLWVTDGCSAYHEAVTSLGTDDSGNVYMAGFTEGEYISFGGNLLTNNGSTALFLVKYNQSGNLKWGRIASAWFGSTQALGMFVGRNGECTLTGNYDHSSLQFDNLTLIHTGSDYNSNTFIVKYNRNGNDIWANSISDSSSCYGNGITCDRYGNSYITGFFGNGIDSTTMFGNMELFGNHDIYVCALDSSGNFLWVNSAAGLQNTDEGTSIQVDSIGNIYTSGNLRSSNIDFGSIQLTNTGYGIFLSKMTSYVYVKQPEKVNGIAIFPNPTTNEFKIISEQTLNTIEIVNALGQVVQRENINQKSLIDIDVQSLPNGIYFVNIIGYKSNDIFKLLIER